MLTDRLSASIYRWLQYLFFVGAVICFLIANICADMDLLLVAVLLLFLFSLLYGLECIKDRFIYVFFNFACMFFLYGRNVIELLSGENWSARFPDPINLTTCNILFLSQLFLFLGALACQHISERKVPLPECSQQNTQKEIFLHNLRKVSFWMYLFCAVFSLLCEGEKIILMQGQDYAHYYTGLQSRLPSVFSSIAALAKFCLCVFLATRPRKATATVVLVIYIISAVPMFIIGQRNSLISAFAFAVCYFIIRQSNLQAGEKKWFGKGLVIAIVVALPFLMAFLSLYESIRQGISVSNVNIFESVLNLFRTQGITYNVIAKGISHMEELPSTNINYTFGPIIEYFRSNTITQMLFHTASYKKQSIEMALYGNSFGDTISYLELGEGYFTGAGLGSSYMVEAFVDFGYTGLCIFSLVLGYLQISMVKSFGKNPFTSFVSMVFLLQLFMLPRSSATGWAVLLLYIPMYVLLFGIVMLTGLLQKNTAKRKGKLCF